MTRNWYFPDVVAGVLGQNLAIRIQELGAFMAYLATGGEEEGIVIYNARIVEKGRELLQAATK